MKRGVWQVPSSTTLERAPGERHTAQAPGQNGIAHSCVQFRFQHGQGELAPGPVGVANAQRRMGLDSVGFPGGAVKPALAVRLMAGSTTMPSATPQRESTVSSAGRTGLVPGALPVRGFGTGCAPGAGLWNDRLFVVSRGAPEWVDGTDSRSLVLAEAEPRQGSHPHVFEKALTSAQDQSCTPRTPADLDRS